MTIGHDGGYGALAGKAVAPVLLAFAGITFPGALGAQPAALVKDIRTTPSSRAHLEPRQLASAGATLYFAGRSEESGLELWKSDGTSAGTVLVKDIWPGTADLPPVMLPSPFEMPGSGDPHDLQVVNGKFFFNADDGNTGRELWTSDGTPAGTFLLKDIFPGANSSVVTNGRSGVEAFVSAVNGTYLFFADDGVHGSELWRTDGTPAGTALLMDICPGACSSEVRFVRPAVMGGHLYFRVAYAYPGGAELWRSDGTAAGTAPVPGIPADPRELTAMGSHVYFAAWDSAQGGQELWRTDGTPGGVSRVKDINPGGGSSGPHQLRVMGSTLFFAADDGTHGAELWKSDGTDAGTVLVLDVNPGSLASEPRSLAPVGSWLGFVATTALAGHEVWRSDGTASGTFMLADAPPGPASGFPNHLIAHQGQLAWGTIQGVWWSDGSVAGTRQLEGLGAPTDLASAGNAVYVSAYGGGNAAGHELWRTDGTVGGTTLVKDTVHRSSHPRSFTILGGRLLFSAEDEANGFEPWTSDGTSAGTSLILDLCPGLCSSIFDNLETTFASLGGFALFAAQDWTSGPEVWRTDGTQGGTQLVQDSAPGTDGTYPSGFLRVGSRVYYRAALPSFNVEPWTSDGTDAGTHHLGDINPGPQGSHPGDFAQKHGLLVFPAFNNAGPALWRSDGTSAGTVSFALGSFGELQKSGSLVFAVRFTFPNQLFATDTTADGTYVVSTEPKDPMRLTDVGGTLFFAASTPASGQELWKSDGTEAGTVMVRDIAPGTFGSRPSSLVAANGILFFTASDIDHGVELWRSDGTAAGTYMVKDIVPGAAGSVPLALAEVNGRLYFSAYEPGVGLEPWTSDGTEAGTLRIQDIAPGPASSSPRGFRIVGTRLFFVADDGVTGHELWSLPGVLPSLALAGVSVHEGDAGTRPATFRVRVLGERTTPVTTSYATADGTAAAGSDYVGVSGPLTFPVGVDTRDVDVSVNGDAADERDEDFFLDLGAVTGAVPLALRARAVIVDDDSPVTASVGDASRTEGDTGLTPLALDVTLSGPRGVPVTVDYTSADGTATTPTDYVAVSGTITFTPGQILSSVPVPIVGDQRLEFDESFSLLLSNPVNATLGDGHATVHIVNDETLQEPGQELTHGDVRTLDLTVPAVFRITQQPYSSYEVVVDAVSGDAQPVLLQLVDSTFTLVLGQGYAEGTGNSLVLPILNLTGNVVQDRYVRLTTPACVPCGVDDTYRIRLRETTLASPRFNNIAPQRTVVTVQNRSHRLVSAVLYFWSADGTLIYLQVVTLPPRSVLKLESADIPGLAGQSGSITLLHNGRYGDLAGKAAAVDTLNGFSFDHAFGGRPR